MDALSDYLAYIDEQWCRLDPDGLWQAPVLCPDNLNWRRLAPCQRFSVIALCGNATERTKAFRAVARLKPAGVTWQDILDKCFNSDLRQPLTERLGRRNRRN